ncbi:hypothetical protein [Streptomyces sp. NPDC046887]|uniref:hypothetical protein n=1 Tax=Streptomyces sp. NPDC046887 TaxID=3155472 RepID=UPI003403F893
MEKASEWASEETGIREAVAAVTELRAALERAGIALPSLGVDPVTCAASYGRPLVELGRCTAETARLLAAALPGKGADREPAS